LTGTSSSSSGELKKFDRTYRKFLKQVLQIIKLQVLVFLEGISDLV
jgi:hypothetical protein